MSENFFSSSATAEEGYGWQVAVVVVLAFFCELVDTALGMGYGTTLTPVLMTPGLGFDRKTIVQSILVSEFCTGLLASIFHALFGNMQIGDRKRQTKISKALLPRKLYEYIEKLTAKDEQELAMLHATVAENCTDVIAIVEVESPASENSIPPLSRTPEEQQEQTNKKQDEPPKGKWQKFVAWADQKLTIDTQVIVIMALTGCLGTIVSAVLGAIKDKKLKFAIKLYIGIMVLAMGVIMFAVAWKKWSVRYKSWKIGILGIITGFNKGISGGGYGPISVSGQVISGRPERNAIATTSASEAIICLCGIITDITATAIVSSKSEFASAMKLNYALSGWMALGACCSVPFSTLATRIIRSRSLRYVVSLITILLGFYSIISAVLSFKGIWSG